MRFSSRRLSSLLPALFLAAAPAYAAAPTRVFVSGKGADAAACGDSSAPCRTLQYAHGRVAPGGEIDVMDSAEFGPLKITKAVSIVNDGTGVASLTQTATGQNAIWINVGDGAVTLRGLTLEGAGVATTGIYFVGGASVRIANCALRNFKNVGIYAAPPAFAKMSIADSSFSDSGGGVLLAPKADFSATITRSQAFGVGNAFEVSGRNAPAGTAIFVAAEDSLASGSAIGFIASNTAGKAIPTFALTRVTAVGNSFGVVANGGNMRLSASMLSGNGTGASVSNGEIYSMKNNAITDNGAKVLGALTDYTGD